MTAAGKFIPFSYRLKAGESSFDVPVPRETYDRGQNDIYLSVVAMDMRPDYFSRQAGKLGMDPKSETDSALEFQMSIKIQYTTPAGAFEQQEYTFPSNNNTPHEVMKTLNEFFDGVKKPEMILSPCVIDWVHTSYRGSNLRRHPPGVYHSSIAKDIYGEPFDEAKHMGSIPASWISVKQTLNPLKMPTKPEALKGVRMRIHIAPYCKVTFPNSKILSYFGMSLLQMGQRGRNFQYYNNAPEIRTIEAANPPAPLFVTEPKSFRVTVSNTLRETVVGPVTVTVARPYENDWQHWADKLSNAAFKLTSSRNLMLTFDYKSITKKFLVMFPKRTDLNVTLFLPGWVGYKLGYGYVDRLDKHSVPEPLEENEIESLETVTAYATSLVMDVGWVQATCENAINKEVANFGNSVVATLRPAPPGVWTTGSENIMKRAVAVNYNEPSINVRLWRYSERGIPSPLEFRIDAYVQLALAVMHK